MRVRWAGTVGGLACTVALLGGCSQSVEGTATAAPGSSARPTPAGEQELSSVVLQPADLPSGWTAGPAAADRSDPADHPADSVDAAMLTCTGGTDTSADEVASADSATFTHGDVVLSSSATSYRSQDSVDADVAALTDPRVPDCLETYVRDGLAPELPDGATVDDVAVSVTPRSGGDPDGVVATATADVTVTAAGQALPVHLTVVFLTGPLLEATVQAASFGADVPADVLDSAVAAVAARAAG
jgi:hypothetical protein